jgi:hypothetical protein
MAWLLGRWLSAHGGGHAPPATSRWWALLRLAGVVKKQKVDLWRANSET